MSFSLLQLSEDATEQEAPVRKEQTTPVVNDEYAEVLSSKAGAVLLSFEARTLYPLPQDLVRRASVVGSHLTISKPTLVLDSLCLSISAFALADI